jgi:hypothetical protein
MKAHERRNNMQTAKQVSVSLVNKPGRLAAMLGALSKGKVTFRALSVMDSGDRGTVRFVPDDIAATAEVLGGMNVRYDTADVLLVEVPNNSGAFRKICERLAADHLNIDYAYCAFSAENGSRNHLAVVKVNDLARAQKVLTENTATGRKKMPGRRPVHAR